MKSRRTEFGPLLIAATVFVTPAVASAQMVQTQHAMPPPTSTAAPAGSTMAPEVSTTPAQTVAATPAAAQASPVGGATNLLEEQPPRVEQGSRFPFRALAIATGIGTVAGVVIGSVLLAMQQDRVHAYNNDAACYGWDFDQVTMSAGTSMGGPGTAPADQARCHQYIADGNAFAAESLVSYLVGGALGLITIGLLIGPSERDYHVAPNERTHARARRPRFDCGVGPGTFGVACSGTF